MSEENSPFTTEEKKLVTNSWAILKQEPVKNGIAIFTTFFKMYPKYQQYFSFKNVPLDQLPEDKRLKRHAAGVFAAFTSLVDNLDNLEVLISLLEGIGERHGRRKIEAQSFDDLIETVVEFVRQGTGDACTEETEKAWRKTLEVATSIIKKNLEIDE